ncbi:MAG: hypothetical protein ACM31M_01775 [Nitrososphaerota archaeon]
MLENHAQNSVTNATIDTDIDNNVALEKYDKNLIKIEPLTLLALLELLYIQIL